MNRGKPTYAVLFLALVWLLMPEAMKAQSPFDANYSAEAKGIRESIHLFTDRQLYAVNESIQFVAEYRVEGKDEGSYWSSVLYLELVTSEGVPVSQGKYPLLGSRIKGSLKVPLSALTGDYLLKCYTRWMRNDVPGNFAILPMKIINPYRSEVVSHANGENEDVKISRAPYREEVLDCTTSSSVYGAGDQVKIQFSGALPEYLEQMHCCLSVVPAGAVDLDAGQYLGSSSELERDSYRVSFLPDLGSGVAISGRVVDEQLEAVKFATLHFSLLGNTPDYFATISDEQGRFIFTAPAGLGPQELFVTPQRVNGSPLQVRIDQEFDARPLSLPWSKFDLSDAEKALARKIVLNMQLSKAFHPPSSAKDHEKPGSQANETSVGSKIPFYGSRVQRLLLDDYVRLPNLEEVFINLIPDVQFYTKRGENRIRILSDNASIEIFDPLIMIDNISIFDHEALLALSPEKIERIDLINQVYLKGNVAFGGVLAVYSKKGDMAGIDLPEGSYFFDYLSFHPSSQSIGWQDMDPERFSKDRVPDSRNTLYWNDDLFLQEGEAQEIIVQGPETPGEYHILIRGVDSKGEVLSGTARFRV